MFKKSESVLFYLQLSYLPLISTCSPMLFRCGGNWLHECPTSYHYVFSHMFYKGEEGLFATECSEDPWITAASLFLDATECCFHLE